MHALLGVVLIASAFLRADQPSKAPKRVATAACTLGFKGRIERSAVLLQPGSPPLASQATEEFQMSIPGRIEEWEEGPGLYEFRFIPTPTFEKASGTFKTNQKLTRPMIETTTSIEGSKLVGLGTWYLHAPNMGGQIFPQNTDVSMRGTVTASNDQNLKVGRENVPVSVLVVPILLTKDQQTQMPPFKFTGLSLWALQKNKAPFTAQGELVFNHRGERDSVRGTVQVTFDLDPTR